MKTFLIVLAISGLFSGTPFLHAQQKPGTKPTAQDMQVAVLGDLSQGNLQKVEEYLKAGFDPKTPIGCGTFDSLDGAVQRNNPEMVELLLRYGARPKESTFVDAASRPSPDNACKIVKLFLDVGSNVNSKERYPDDTALHRAAYKGNVELIKMLLSQKGIALNEIDIDGRTPLMIAVENGNKQVVKLLLAAGADPAIKDPKTKRTAESLASEEIANRQEIKKLLLSGVATNANTAETSDQTVKVGMTRGEIEKKFQEDGGFSTIPSTRFILPGGRKVNVDFEMRKEEATIKRPISDKDDKAVKVSEPYVEAPSSD